MKVMAVIEGLTILTKYWDDLSLHHLEAIHHLEAVPNVLCALRTNRPVSDGDIKRLIELGWFQNEGNYEEDEAFTPELYDREAEWFYYL